MQFVSPTFLYALSALAIPIIIHLFYFRRFKKVYFTNVRFLKEVKEENSSRRKLRNLLVLLSRCLALVFLVLAFAQPFLPKSSDAKKGEKAVSLFIDNSFSMSAMSKDVSLLEKAKQRAREIIQAYTPDDKFQILTNDFEGRHQRLVSKDDAIGLIDEIKTSPSVKDLSKIISQQQQTLSTAKTINKTAFVLSDFQKNTTDLNNIKDSLLDVNLITMQAVEEKNIAIDSAWFEAPVQMVNQTNPLVVRVHNYSKQDVDNIKVSLNYDGQIKPVGTINIKANSVKTDTINITLLRTGWHNAELEITDFPIQYDDHYFFTFNVPAVINVLNINEGSNNKYLDIALGGMKGFKLANQSSGGIQYSTFPSYQMIVLNGLTTISSGLASELNQFAKNGGNVLVFPSQGADLTAYNAFLNNAQANSLSAFEPGQKEVSTVNTEEFVFNDVFANKGANLKLPTTLGNYRLTNRSGEILLGYRDGTPYLTKNKVGQGNIYLSASPIDEKFSNLTRNGEVFIPMLYKMAISSAKEWKIAYTIGKDEFIEADSRGIAGQAQYKLKGAKGEFIPEQRIVANKAILGVKENIKTAGFYGLYTKPDSTLFQYAFNYDRRESDLNYLSTTDLKGMERKNIHIMDAAAEANFTALVGEQTQGTHYWRWCVILALLFLAAEILLIRLWRV
jgi:hypothetical protein